MERYEYHIIQLPKQKDRLEVFSKLGSESWDLVQIYSGFAYFKRLKRMY